MLAYISCGPYRVSCALELTSLTQGMLLPLRCNPTLASSVLKRFNKCRPVARRLLQVSAHPEQQLSPSIAAQAANVSTTSVGHIHADSRHSSAWADNPEVGWFYDAFYCGQTRQHSAKPVYPYMMSTCCLDMQDSKHRVGRRVREQKREDGTQQEGGATGDVTMMDSLLMEDIDFSSRTISQMQTQTPKDLKAVQ